MKLVATWLFGLTVFTIGFTLLGHFLLAGLYFVSWELPAMSDLPEVSLLILRTAFVASFPFATGFTFSGEGRRLWQI